LSNKQYQHLKVTIAVRVTLLTNLVPPYRFAAYDALHHRAISAGGGLRVLCTQHREPQRNWATPKANFEQVTLPGVQIPLGENRTFTLPFGVTRPLADQPTDALVLAGFGIAQWQAQNWAWKRGIPTVLQFDGWSGSDAAYANPVRRRLRQMMISRADGFIAAGTRGATWFESHGIARENISIAPIPPSFSVPEASTNRMQYDLLWCGRTTRSKGFDVFIQVAEALSKAGIVARVAIVGSTNIAETIATLRASGINDQADVFGQLPPDQLPAILTNSKIALFPSRNDAYGVGVIDAISCGTVALASPMTGCAPDILCRPEILPTDVPNDWIKACEQLLGTPALLETTRQNQAKAIINNDPVHHGETIWNAINQAAHRKSETRQWG
tara:strand:- start:5161 stop:6315 length:1155 start_codon:yes stop_codon:yes gene_type:complete